MRIEVEVDDGCGITDFIAELRDVIDRYDSDGWFEVKAAE